MSKTTNKFAPEGRFVTQAAYVVRIAGSDDG